MLRHEPLHEPLLVALHEPLLVALLAQFYIDLLLCFVGEVEDFSVV